MCTIELTAQNPQNLVSNCGFELDDNEILFDPSNCLAQSGIGKRCPLGNTFGAYPDQIDYYNGLSNWTLPNKKAFCLFGVSSSGVACTNPRSGLMHSFTSSSEFVTQQLKNTLNPASTYYIELYFLTSETAQNRGIQFCENQPSQCKASDLDIGNNFDIKLINNTSELYEKKTLYYKPLQGDLNWITLGVVDDDRALQFDDVRIFEVGDDKCADGDWELQNTDLYTWSYSANDNMIAGSSVSSLDDAFTGEVIVKPGN